MSIETEIKKLFESFGKDLADDLTVSLTEVLKANGRKSPQQPNLHFNPVISTDGAKVTLSLRASEPYWRFIQSGRKPGAKRLPADAVGKVWQNENNINALKVVLSLRKQPTTQRKLKRPARKLTYDKAAKSLSFIIQRSIFKKGIKPKPFVDRVLSDGRIAKLKQQLTPLLKAGFELEITI